MDEKWNARNTYDYRWMKCVTRILKSFTVVSLNAFFRSLFSFAKGKAISAKHMLLMAFNFLISFQERATKIYKK